jgi:hypothetical protein
VCLSGSGDCVPFADPHVAHAFLVGATRQRIQDQASCGVVPGDATEGLIETLRKAAHSGQLHDFVS